VLSSLFATIQTFLTNPEFLVPTMWVAFGCTLAWYLLSAKRFHSIDKKELKLLWETHKQFNNCPAEDYEPILKGKKTVGYKCQCGHQHIQQRPLIDFGA
jgi:hypothetical protein